MINNFKGFLKNSLRILMKFIYFSRIKQQHENVKCYIKAPQYIKFGSFHWPKQLQVKQTYFFEHAILTTLICSHVLCWSKKKP